MGIPYILFGKREPSSSTSINHLVLNLLSYNQISSARHPEGLIAHRPIVNVWVWDSSTRARERATEGFISQMDRWAPLEVCEKGFASIDYYSSESDSQCGGWTWFHRGDRRREESFFFITVTFPSKHPEAKKEFGWNVYKYRTLVIFVYIVITLSAYQLVPRKRPFASRIEVFDVVACSFLCRDLVGVKCTVLYRKECIPSEMPKRKGTRRRRCISGTGGIGQALR